MKEATLFCDSNNNLYPVKFNPMSEYFGAVSNVFRGH